MGLDRTVEHDWWTLGATYDWELHEPAEKKRSQSESGSTWGVQTGGENPMLCEMPVNWAQTIVPWQAKRHAPRILEEANVFVEKVAGGDLDTWSKKFKSPLDVVGYLATQVYYQGAGSTETRKKMWMLMRWLVRPTPDLRLWDHFSPADLMVPVDRHVARFAHAAGILGRLPKNGPFWSQVVEITDFARELFPKDPARVDYAFFMWGRGKTRPAGDPDTCHTLFGVHGIRCPLKGVMPCSSYCS